MNKKLLLAIVTICLTACSGNSNNTPNRPEEFEAECGEGCTKPVLTLLNESNFELTLNLCESIEKVEGTYNKIDDIYSFEVSSCTTCSEDELGLSDMEFEMTRFTNDELTITSEFYRLEAGEKLYFCAPSNDPNNEFDGEDYNTFRKKTKDQVEPADKISS